MATTDIHAKAAEFASAPNPIMSGDRYAAGLAYERLCGATHDRAIAKAKANIAAARQRDLMHTAKHMPVGTMNDQPGWDRHLAKLVAGRVA